jgi:pilus assembly protein CpaB
LKKVYILAILMAIIAAISVYYFATSLQQKTQVQDVETGYAVVVLTDIPQNTMITEEMVIVKEFSLDAVHPMAITSAEEVVGMIARYPLLVGEQILLSKIGEKGSEAEKLSYTLEPGQRAISIAVDEVAGIAGYISSGDYVDVVATIIIKGELGEPSKPVSTLFVENLLVLETGMKQTGAADDISAVYESVTVSATPKQILKINYASTNGTLRLALRPVLDYQELDLPFYAPQ